MSENKYKIGDVVEIWDGYGWTKWILGRFEINRGYIVSGMQNETIHLYSEKCRLHRRNPIKKKPQLLYKKHHLSKKLSMTIWECTYSSILLDRLMDKSSMKRLSEEERDLLFGLSYGYVKYDGYGTTVFS